ncbi:glycoside hydrolase family 30 protein [Schizophyllum commune Tattone D]|nr:glycoside hydrolase family 30 protein [Schizophyllum commune Tattone D]
MNWTFAVNMLVVAQIAVAQQIYDVWQTKWDRTSLLSSVGSANPVNFTTPGGAKSADIVVHDTQVYQSIYGFGGSLTDSAALTLNNLKNRNINNYWNLLRYLFDPTDGAIAAGLSYVRVPLGASDFSAGLYSFDDVNGDTSFTNFNINRAPSYLFSVLRDIQSVNRYLKVHVVPWSPPGWMKTTGTMNGGSLKTQYLTPYATYLLKCLQGFKSQGVNLYAISIQNEPQNSNPTYPTAVFTPAQEAQVGNALRALMNSNGFGGVKLVGYEHNWDTAAAYPVTLINDAPNAFVGVAFHCYAGNVGQMDSFHNAHPNKEIYFTECAGLVGSDWWSDIKWYTDNIFIGGVNHNAATGLMWNIALDGNGNPKLPNTNSCGGPGCRAIAQVNSDGSWSVNQEFYAMAHVSKATIPKDVGGPMGRRIGTTVSGSIGWGLVTTAFVTERVNKADWQRYSLVVLNYADNTNGAWNPQPIQTTIQFRGKQATFTFPVGVTTLWWYAASPSAKDAAGIEGPNATATEGSNTTATEEGTNAGNKTVLTNETATVSATRRREEPFVYKLPRQTFAPAQ